MHSAFAEAGARGRVVLAPHARLGRTGLCDVERLLRLPPSPRRRDRRIAIVSGGHAHPLVLDPGGESRTRVIARQLTERPLDRDVGGVEAERHVLALPIVAPVLVLLLDVADRHRASQW